MAQHLIQANAWTTPRSQEVNDVWRTILLYDGLSGGDEEFGSLVDSLRPHYQEHAKRMAGDAHEQSLFAAFLAMKAGNRILIDALCWLREGWQRANSYFWDTVVQRGHFARLLEHTWREHRTDIRNNTDAFAAFKTLTLNLAAHHVPAALAVQEELGSESK